MRGGSPAGRSAWAAVKGLKRRRFYLRLPELQAIRERLRAPARPRSAAAAGGGGSSEGVNPVAAASSGKQEEGDWGAGGSSSSRRRGTEERAVAAAAAGLLGMERSRVTRM